MRDIIDAARSLGELLETVPDSPRKRFIECCVEAARLAIQMDAPRSDLHDRFWTLMAMTENNLTAWEEA